ncbi:MAG: tyrosine-protein phosphatase [Planctomycetes bacterium]|nr:tyrosine-protein phosphatase [Planctomycetota bacterium]
MIPRALALSALLLTPLGARELELIGVHALRGLRDGQAYRGTLTVEPDASFTCTRTFADGREERSAGVARFDRVQLVLEEAGRARSFSLDSAYEPQRWTWQGGGDREQLEREVARENLPRFFKRLERDGKPLRWLLERNRAYVERGAGLWIQRSRQPRPRDVEAFRKQGGHTILSLNGDQDEAVDDLRLERALRLRSPKGPQVNLREFIAQQGLHHVSVDMSAQRAPTDAELVTVFRTLLDDSLRPILVHCQGGSDRTGIVCALYAYEFLGVSKAEAKTTMRRHLWAAVGGTEVQGAYLDLYRKGRLRELLREAGVEIPARYR